MNLESSGSSTWNTDFMRDCKEKWTLADDVSLLKYLETFSENILTKANCTLKSLDNFENSLSGTCVTNKTVSNMFQALADTQFVENRVYDEEDHLIPVYSETLKEKINYKEQSSDDSIKEVLLKCLHTLDNNFETVQLSGSESEGEEDNAAFSKLILKPVNRYRDRPLPHLIGSEEFMKDDTLGLVPFSFEDSENEEDESDESSQHSINLKKEEHPTEQDEDFVEDNLAQQLSAKLSNMQEPSPSNTYPFEDNLPGRTQEKEVSKSNKSICESDVKFHDTLSAALKEKISDRKSAAVLNRKSDAEARSNHSSDLFSDDGRILDVPQAYGPRSALFPNKNVWSFSGNDSIFDNSDASLFDSDNTESKLNINNKHKPNGENEQVNIGSKKDFDSKHSGINKNISPECVTKEDSLGNKPIKKTIFDKSASSDLFGFDGDLFADDGDLFNESKAPQISQNIEFLIDENDEFDDLFSNSIITSKEISVSNSNTSSNESSSKACSFLLDENSPTENNKPKLKFEQSLNGPKDSKPVFTINEKNMSSQPSSKTLMSSNKQPGHSKSDFTPGELLLNDQDSDELFLDIGNKNNLKSHEKKNDAFTWNISSKAKERNLDNKFKEKLETSLQKKNETPEADTSADSKQQSKKLIQPLVNVILDDALPPLITTTLHCLSKERVKIQTKRRLPSRKSRNFEKRDRSPDTVKTSIVLSPSTDEEDLFVIPPLDLCKEKSSSDLFAGAVLLSPGTAIDNEAASSEIKQKQNDHQKTEEDPFNSNQIEAPTKFSNDTLFTKENLTQNNVNDLDDIFADNQVEDIFSSPLTITERRTKSHLKSGSNEQEQEDNLFNNFDDDDLFTVSDVSKKQLQLNNKDSDQTENRSKSSTISGISDELFGGIPSGKLEKSSIFDNILEDEDIFSDICIGHSFEPKPIGKAIRNDSSLIQHKSSPVSKQPVQLKKREVFHDPLMSTGDNNSIEQ